MKTWLCFSWLHLQAYPPAQFHLCTNPLFLVICLDNLKLWCAGYFSSVNAVPPSACSPGELLAGHQLLWQELPKALPFFCVRLCLGSSRFVRPRGSFPLRPLNTALGKSLGCAEIDLGTLETNPWLWLHWHTAHTLLSDTNLIYTTPTLALHFFYFVVYFSSYAQCYKVQKICKIESSFRSLNIFWYIV